LTSQQRGTCSSGGEGQAAEIATRVHNGFFVNQREFGARRNIRKLCGRQALVDLLARAKQERQRELQHLLEHRPVSDFAHRNRIQAILLLQMFLFLTFSHVFTHLPLHHT